MEKEEEKVLQDAGFTQSILQDGFSIWEISGNDGKSMVASKEVGEPWHFSVWRGLYNPRENSYSGEFFATFEKAMKDFKS